MHGNNTRNLPIFLLLSFMFFFLLQNQGTRGQNRFCPEAAGGLGGVAQIMYTHVSKCKNDKIKQIIYSLRYS
jgi:hypothetical protein